MCINRGLFNAGQPRQNRLLTLLPLPTGKTARLRVILILLYYLSYPRSSLEPEVVPVWHLTGHLIPRSEIVLAPVSAQSAQYKYTVHRLLEQMMTLSMKE